MTDNVAVIYGGDCEERSVSLLSGELVVAELGKLGIDAKPLIVENDPLPVLSGLSSEAVIIMLHGSWGENGKLQGLLDIMGIPYSGSRPLPSALAMHKHFAKIMLKGNSIPTPQWEFIKNMEDISSATNNIGLPFVVKPASEGSSVGIFYFEKEFSIELIQRLLRDHSELIIEKYIEGKILTVPIIEVPQCTKVLSPIQVIPERSKLYDRTAKKEGLRSYNFSPDLCKSELRNISDVALDAHRALGCWGITRVDIMHSYDEGPFVLEVNTIPGMSAGGNLISACEAQGIGRAELIGYLLNSIK